MISLLLAIAPAVAVVDDPPSLLLLDANPRYLEFRGKPAILVASGEHYGAVLNRDFDTVAYLDALKAHGLNLTRTFSGTYLEVPGSFRIEDNTLAPAPGRYLGPWVRLDDGRFDLDRFEPAYFERLSKFVADAGERGIVVEYVLFCPFYSEDLWAVNPMNARNNVNGVGDHGRFEAYDGRHEGLLRLQLAFVRKAVAELNRFDNVYFEVCNEPYFGGVTDDWQRRIAREIADAEAKLPRRHPIARNIANGQQKVVDPDPLVTIFNFHYATPPDTVALNAPLNRPIGDDETGFRGVEDRAYRREAWEFLLAGGAIFSNLDYSFTTASPDGRAEVRPPTPGGGGPRLRRQLGFLKAFLERFDFPRMKPDRNPIAKDRQAARALVEPGRQYAIYLANGDRKALEIDLPAGRYEATWFDPAEAKAIGEPAAFRHEGGVRSLSCPPAPEDLAIRIVALD
ncbi:MAG: hypothetical protein U0800_26190 [Isosphaeraceae bacterium]